MASGQQKAKQTLDAFHAWVATQSNDDFKQIIHRGKLKREELAKAIGCGKSALVQNPALREAIANLENNLRDQGVLPPVANQASDKLSESNKVWEVHCSVVGRKQTDTSMGMVDLTTKKLFKLLNTGLLAYNL